ncbi:MAG: hypothetical protein ABH821_03665 [archaeon]
MRKIFLMTIVLLAVSLMSFSVVARDVCWHGFLWNIEQESGGLTAKMENNQFIVDGTSESGNWSAKVIASATPRTLNSVSADISVDSEGSESSSAIAINDGDIIISVGKHFNNMYPEWNTDCAVSSSRHGLIYSGPKNPTNDFSNYKVVITENGFEAYCDNELVATITTPINQEKNINLRTGIAHSNNAIHTTYKNLRVNNEVINFGEVNSNNVCFLPIGFH